MAARKKTLPKINFDDDWDDIRPVPKPRPFYSVAVRWDNTTLKQHIDYEVTVEAFDAEEAELKAAQITANWPAWQQRSDRAKFAQRVTCKATPV